jgi:hypothetical protein
VPGRYESFEHVPAKLMTRGLSGQERRVGSRRRQEVANGENCQRRL